MPSRRTRRLASCVRTLAAILATGIAATADAASSRTFVASNGNDANPCSLALPCRSFSAALPQTTAAGEIVVLDSAGYGTVVIDKAVTISAPEGVHAGISVPAGGVGVLVLAGTADDVLLRGLSISGPGAGNERGIVLQSAGTLTVDRCTIRGMGVLPFSSPAPKPPPPVVAALHLAGPGNLLVRNSLFTRNFTALFAGYSGSARAVTIEHSTFADNQTGVDISDNVDLTLADTVLTGTGTTSGIGLYASGTAPGSRFQVTRSTIRRFQWGIFAIGLAAASNVVVADSDISHNSVGIYTVAGGNVWLTGTRVTHNATGVNGSASPVHTSGTNFFADNTTDGDPLLPPAGVK